MKITKLALLILLTVFASPGASAADDGAKAPIRIGVLLSLSGNWAQLGEMTRLGLTLAAEQINARGGVLGRPIELTYQDTDEAVSAAKVVSAYRFLRTRGIDLFIGPTGSPGGIAIAPIAAHDDVVMISPSVGVKDFHLQGDNLFNTQGVWEYASEKLAAYVYARGVHTLAVLASQQPFEIRQGDAFQEAFRAAGGTVVARSDPLPDKTDLRSELLEIIAQKPEAVFFADYNQMGLAAKQLRELGFHGRQFATLIDESRLADAGALEGTVFSRITDKPSQSFEDEFRRRFGKATGYPADFAFDALEALSRAVTAAGAADPAKVKRTLLGVAFDGASGRVQFDKAGCIIRKPSVWRVVAGKFEAIRSLE